MLSLQVNDLMDACRHNHLETIAGFNAFKVYKFFPRTTLGAASNLYPSSAAAGHGFMRTGRVRSSSFRPSCVGAQLRHMFGVCFEAVKATSGTMTSPPAQ